jgi:hypothetical protein
VEFAAQGRAEIYGWVERAQAGAQTGAEAAIRMQEAKRDLFQRVVRTVA